MESKSKNWTIHDKIAMYKGLIKICERERKNQLHDSTQLMKQNEQNINQLRSEIKELRVKFSMADKGASADVAALLQQNKQLQLIYQNKNIEEMKEDLIIRNATQRQYLNKLLKETEEAERKLLKTTNELEKLENENKPDDGKRDHRQTLNNKIQEFGAKTLLSRNIQCLFQKAIKFLQKDETSYSAILEDLKENAKLQQISIIRATEMGQLAAEEMANMREEYYLREHDVRINMEMHQNGLLAFQHKWNQLVEESQTLIHAESMPLDEDFAGKKETPDTELQKQVTQLNDLLKSMQNAILVPGFEDILPRMLEQFRQNEKLLEDLQTSDNLFDLLPKKITHGQLILSATINQSEENAALFMNDKELLLKELKDLNDKITEICKERQELGNLVTQIKNSLACIWAITEKIPENPDIIEDYELEITEDFGILNEAQMYLKRIQNKSKHLFEDVDKKLKKEDLTRAITLKARQLKKIQNVEEKNDASKVTIHLFEDIEDPAVPNRADIKAKSKKIYDLATANPYAIPDK